MSFFQHVSAKTFADFEGLQAVIVLACVAIAILRPSLLSGPLARLERSLAAVASRPRVSLTVIALLAIVARLIVLPLAGVPRPILNDETSLWLQAQTYLAGRLANGPVGQDFEAIYVITHPAYASMYPVLRAAPLAAAGLLGLGFWFGVLASMVLLAMAVYWALKAWIRAPYALVGALLVIVRYGLFSMMINSYLGSAFTALGGALVLGGYKRFVDRRRLVDGVALGCGVFILITTRPYEGLVFSLAFALGVIVHGLRLSGADRRAIVKGVAAASTIVFVGFALTALGDAAATGDWRVQPTSLYRQIVAPTPPFMFQPLGLAEGRYDINRIFIDAEKVQWSSGRSPRGLAAMEVGRLLTDWKFYIGYVGAIPFAVGMVALARRRVLWLALGGLGVALMVVTWGLARYLLPAFTLIILVIMAGLQRLRRWRPGARPVGLALSRLLPLSAVIGLSIPIGAGLAGDRALAVVTRDGVANSCCILATTSIHTRISDRLMATPGRHIVVVDTGPRARLRGGDIRYREPLVWNEADVAGSRIIWLNEDPILNPETFRRYPGRRLWRLDWRADGSPWLHPYVGERAVRGAGGAALTGGAAGAGGPT